MASPFVAAIASDVKGELLSNAAFRAERFSARATDLVKRVVMASVDIDFANPLPVRSGGIANPTRALELARAMAAVEGSFRLRRVQVRHEFGFRRRGIRASEAFWKERGGLE